MKEVHTAIRRDMERVLLRGLYIHIINEIG